MAQKEVGSVGDDKEAGRGLYLAGEGLQVLQFAELVVFCVDEGDGFFELGDEAHVEEVHAHPYGEHPLHAGFLEGQGQGRTGAEGEAAGKQGEGGVLGVEEVQGGLGVFEFAQAFF